ncbi:nodulation protein NfeD [Massilia sp. G4R7]|uniref:Nodulation protein NfeD n=1 Tax=Massilia phyllostachyos TaxID=2898585 RepID=A0ABS8Q387_9BURK|nr:nodulation protein NfeD [Massilia phyllostachyos]MCD2516208.1 nodulation protein NfeD [Massilia phyllostachyos]
MRYLAALALLIAALLPMPALAAPASAHAPVCLLGIDGALGPATADHVVRGIDASHRRGCQLLVLRMDTPGGLDTAMRGVIKAILASRVPVAAFVAPSGARAASAGTYLLYASHIAAMAPGTNVGAATPVAIGTRPGEAPAQPGAGKPDGGASAMERKALNDAAAYLRSLAQLRGRNADWAEGAVRESLSLSAGEAQRLGVADLNAPDVAALLAQLDGRSVTVLGQERRLATRGAPLVEFAPDWRTEVLAALTNPSVALLLMTVGIYGLVFEFMNPGAVAPGVIGAICLLLGLYALQLLPVNYAGLALIALGLVFMGLEAFLPSFGILGLGGVAAFVAGALMLIDTELPGYGIPLGLLVPLAVASALLLFATARLALRTRRRPVAGGMVGMLATVERIGDSSGHEAWVHVEGESWRALSSAVLVPGQAVRVLGRSGLTLEVAPIVDKELP